MRWLLVTLFFCSFLHADIGIRNMRSEKHPPCFRLKPQPCKCSETVTVYEPKVRRIEKNVTVEERCNQRVIQYEPVYTKVKRCRMVPEYYYETVCSFVPSYTFKPATCLKTETEIVEVTEMKPKKVKMRCKRKGDSC